MSLRLLRGEEVEEQIKGSVAEFATRTEKELTTKREAIEKQLQGRFNAVLEYLQGYAARLISDAVSQIPTPKDGHTPTSEEIGAMVAPIMEGVRTDLDARLSRIEQALTTPASELPQDLKGLEEMIKGFVSKHASSYYGGGSPGYFFDILDAPNKAKGLGAAYKGSENKVLKVSADGKQLVWADETTAGGLTPLAAQEDPDGSRTSFTFDAPPIIIATEFGFFIEDAANGFTLNGNVATLPMAPSNFVKGFK